MRYDPLYEMHKFKNGFDVHNFIKNFNPEVEQDTSILVTSRSFGPKVVISCHGARLVSIFAPDYETNLDDVTLGYSRLEDYVNGHVEMGALIGRYANRIAGGHFKYKRKSYQLTKNEGSSHLHGGFGGTMRHRFKYKAKGYEWPTHYLATMADGEDGYPGNLKISAWHEFLDHQRLLINYTAETDKPTPVNLTNHTYFNLSDEPTILDHYLMINANSYLPVDERLIPTGEIRPVDGTPFDFRKPVRIGDRIDTQDEQLKLGQGYDHNFVLNETGYKTFKGQTLAATLYSPASGRILEVWTTEPGLQFYSGNRLGQNSVPGRRPLIPRAGLCLEPQHFPDSPNQPGFPNTILLPGKQYSSTITLSFKITKPGLRP
jgi:aldose 1-epimerase